MYRLSMAALAILIAFSTPAWPAPKAKPQKPLSDLMQHVHAYVPTIERVRAARAASQAMEAAMASDPAVQAEYNDMFAPRGDAQTLAQAEARWEAHPRLLAFMHDQGLSTEDTTLLPLMMMFSGLSMAFLKPGEMPKPNQYVSQEQIDFHIQNKIELNRYAAEDAVKAVDKMRARLQGLQKSPPAK